MTSPAHRCALAAIACVSIGVALPASAGLADNLLANGDFDADLSSWDTSGTVLPVWSPTDFTQAASSGSALLEIDAAGANVRESQLTQCVAVVPGHHVLSAAGMIADAQPAGRLVVSYILYGNTGCTGGFYAAGGFYLQATDEWTDVGFGVDVQDRPDNRLQIILSIEKDPAGGSLQAHVDHVKVVYAEEILADGFEGLE